MRRFAGARRVALALGLWLASSAAPQLTPACLGGGRAYGQDGHVHVVGLVGAGGQLHLTRDDRLDQGRVAPAFADLLVGPLWPLWGLHVGPAVGASINLSADGGYTEPVFAWQQWTPMPALWAAHGLDGDLPLMAHLGVPLVIEAPTELPGGRGAARLGSGGLELGVGAAYRLLAGVLAYAEADLNLWRGDGGSHLNGALEIGLMLDYEVLP